MPTNADWGIVRVLLIMAGVAYFSGPWTWQTILATAALIFVFTATLDVVTKRFK